jgi:hypothetical protein
MTGTFANSDPTASGPPPRRPGRWRIIPALLVAMIGVAATLVGVSVAQAATGHTVTFVNQTGERIWIGSAVNADGSVNFGRLPILNPGGSGSVEVPENAAPNHWRGKFFARQQCGGSGGTFHCAVGDCGPAEDHCTTDEQPVSLAEFNFDPNDQWGAPWYDVSYVNAVSVPITITPTGVQAQPPGSNACGTVGCPEPLLNACPQGQLQHGTDGRPTVCLNPNRDAQTAYSDAIKARCPKAYAWSKQDTEPGNQTVANCPNCSGFVVTFHSN